MRIHPPCIITPRLLPGVSVGNGYISIEYSDRAPSGYGRAERFRYYIDIDGADEHTADDLQTGAYGGGLQEGLSTLLSFLCAAAEAHDYTAHTGRASDNDDLFPAYIAEWALEHSDEIAMLQVELEERTVYIKEK